MSRSGGRNNLRRDKVILDKIPRTVLLWLKEHHPDVPCWRCARLACAGESDCLCYTKDFSGWEHKQFKDCEGCKDFTWSLECAANEAHSRMHYFGVDALPPMLKDVFAILDEALSNERVINRLEREQTKHG